MRYMNCVPWLFYWLHLTTRVTSEKLFKSFQPPFFILKTHKHRNIHENPVLLTNKVHWSIHTESTCSFQQVSGQKRAGNFGVVSAAFTSFNKIADFKERCNTVERWFGSIDRFMGSGGVQGESEVTSQLLDSIKTDIEDLASNVQGKLIAPRYAQVFQS